MWTTRFPDAGSVHLLEWPELLFSREGGSPGLDPRLRGDTILVERWARLRELRNRVTEAIEPLRRDKTVRSSLEAEIALPDAEDADLLAELFIVSKVTEADRLSVSKTDNAKCGRCWRLLPEVVEDGDLCARCEDVVNA